MVTVGCQEAMFLALRALIAGPQDVLLVSSPCYVGITGAARLLDIELTAVEEREDGFRCADLDAAVRAERARGRRPRAFYVVPDHSNPSGTTMPLETRHALLDLAARQDILILEDSPYRLVSPGPHLPTLKSLDRQRRVVHLGSFSKTAFPGARVGFAVADQLVADAGGQHRPAGGRAGQDQEHGDGEHLAAEPGRRGGHAAGLRRADLGTQHRDGRVLRQRDAVHSAAARTVLPGRPPGRAARALE